MTLAAAPGVTPRVPVEAAVVLQSEVDVTIGAVVHIAFEVGAVETVVVDNHLAPRVIVADMDAPVDNLPRELAVVVCIAAGDV